MSPSTKDERVELRVMAEAVAVWRKAAESCDMTLSNWIRDACWRRIEALDPDSLATPAEWRAIEANALERIRMRASAGKKATARKSTRKGSK